MYMLGQRALAMTAEFDRACASVTGMVFQKFQSPALAGYAVISHWPAVSVVLGPRLGALADRLDPRRIIQAGMLLCIACSLGWGVLFMTGTLELWHAVVLFSLHGMGRRVVWGPASGNC